MAKILNIEDFKSGIYEQQYSYKSFTPEKINHEWNWTDGRISTLLSDANRKIGSLDAYASSVPDIDNFIKMHVAKEATKSSKIEGTRTELEEAFKDDSQIDPERRNDWQEVQNYIEATNVSVEKLKKLPVSTRLLKDAHRILMKHARGQHKRPGEYRTSQNWIGGATIKDAIFIPPDHTLVNSLMSDLEKFLHNEKIEVPELLRIGIAHYQFETIHPFLDGNGRVGRLLITLYLVSKGLLLKPSLYLSEYFERNRSLYYDNLMIARTSNNLGQWLKFFLAGIIETSDNSINTFRAIIKLKDGIESDLIPTLGKRVVLARKLLLHLFKKPIVTVQDVKNELGVSPPTANTLINSFEKLGILHEKTGWKRNREFEFSEYLKIFR